MRKKYTPRKYQEIMDKHMREKPRGACFAEMGLGKTVATLTSIEKDFLYGYESRPALVLAPKRVAVNTWPDEAQKWDHLNNIEVRPIVGTETERFDALKDKNASVFTINYENIPWLIDKLQGRWPFGRVVADESTKLKNFRLKQGGKRSGALSRVAHTRVKTFHELSGTPAPNGLQDLWGQLWFLDQGLRLGKSFKSFEERWFTRGFDGFSLKPKSHAEKEIIARIRDICISLRARDYFDLKEPIVVNKYFDLPKSVRPIYDDMEKNMYVELARDLQGGVHEIEAMNPAVRTNKCLQIANGALYLDNDPGDLSKLKKWKELHDIKLQILEEIVEEAAGMPVLVAYNFQSDIHRLLKAFPKGRLLDHNPQTIRDWNKGKIPILFGHPASMGHGLNLQDGGNIGVIFGPDWNLENYQQFQERNGPVRQLQAGHNRPYFLYHILARNTVDELVLQRLNSKKSVEEILREALKQKGY